MALQERGTRQGRMGRGGGAAAAESTGLLGYSQQRQPGG